MHRIYEKKVSLKWNEILKSVTAFIRKHSGQIAYYACVALVLTAVAVAAERLRPDSGMEETLVLPAVELNVPEVEKAEPRLQVPEGMIELRAYAGQPEWNSVHGHWETHTAVDFVCADGTVRSFSGGTIKTIGKSGVYGGFVEVEQDDMLLRYASIEPSDNLRIGDAVEKGDTIGTADDSMPGEAYMEGHLHLEIVRDGICLDLDKELDKS